MRFDGEQKKKVALAGGVALLFTIAIGSLWVSTSWIVSPGADEFYVLVSRTGDPLPPGRILAEAGQAGVQKRLHQTGWAIYNPITWDTELHRMTTIPAGQLGVLTALDGEPMPPGQVLARILEGKPGELTRCQKGILEDILMPGTYRIHPNWFKVEIKPAITIPPGMVGVVTALTATRWSPARSSPSPASAASRRRSSSPAPTTSTRTP
jgi:hypothetical protein